MADKRHITIHTAIPEGASVTADWTRLKQVVLNLLSNAIKYNRDNGRIDVEAVAVSTNRWRLLVKDSGHGISKDRLPELFQPFNRLGAEDGEIEGTGLGLALARNLIELMHGEMGVESEIGSGSTFWIELPSAGLQN